MYALHGTRQAPVTRNVEIAVKIVTMFERQLLGSNITVGCGLNRIRGRILGTGQG